MTKSLTYRVEYKCRPDYSEWSLFCDRPAKDEEEARAHFRILLTDDSVTDVQIMVYETTLSPLYRLDEFTRDLSEERKAYTKQRVEDTWNNLSTDQKRYVLKKAGVTV